MTKSICLSLLHLTGYHFCCAQTPNPATDPVPPKMDAPYEKTPTVPPFRLLKADSATYYTRDDLKKHRPVLIMYFSPDCDHCKHQTEFILGDYRHFKDIDIVMATYQPFEEMKEFVAHYKLDQYPNIMVGRDEKFFFAPFFRIQSLPYLALYDKDGNLICTYEGTHAAAVILSGFQKK